MTPDGLAALGYTGAGALTVKLLDLVIKWRLGARAESVSEMEAARKIGAELRDELRKQLEELRAENVALETKLDSCEHERLELKALVEKLDNAKKDAEAELRLFKKAADAADTRRDDFETDERGRRKKK